MPEIFRINPNRGISESCIVLGLPGTGFNSFGCVGILNTGTLNIDDTLGQTQYQPIDADLTSLASANIINTIYYRSAAGTWSTVSVGGEVIFTGGVLRGPYISFLTGTASLEPNNIYILTGTLTGLNISWTLPSIANNTNKAINIANRASSSVTITGQNVNEIFVTGLRNNFILNSGAHFKLIDDGYYWLSI